MALADQRLRANLHHATSTIGAKRAWAAAERPDWEELWPTSSAPTIAEVDEPLANDEILSWPGETSA